MHKRACDGDTLLLASRQLGRVLVLVRAEADGIKELARPLDRDAVRRALDKKEGSTRSRLR